MNKRLLTGTILGLGAAGAAYAFYRSTSKTHESAVEPRIDGFVSPGFEAVREAFVENFATRHELGGAICAYYNGEKVVDLWGGVRNKATGEPWMEDTMVVVYSTTKGLAAMTLAIAHSRGWLDYDERVATYWPEFAQNGKDDVTVRQLLAHQAGLFALDQTLDRELLSDPERLASVLARQRPAWQPGTRTAYHAVTLGFYESEILRRIDPQHRTLGQFFQDEIATPLGLDFYIRLPESIPTSRFAIVERPGFAEMLLGFPLRLTLDTFNSHSNFRRSLEGSDFAHDDRDVYSRNLEIPSGGGVGTARAIAHAYGVFATGGKELGLRPETISELTAPAVAPTNGFFDEVIRGDVEHSLGFMKPSKTIHLGQPGSFGTPGAGGSVGFADPQAGLGYSYVTNKMGCVLEGDPRDLALRDAVYESIRALEQTPKVARASA